jgi:hypothetical protein
MEFVVVERLAFLDSCRFGNAAEEELFNRKTREERP